MPIMAVRHFLTLLDLSPSELNQVLARAVVLKEEHRQRIYTDRFRNHVLGMIFEKSSTRTRVSFEAGMAQMGGHAMFLAPKDTQLGRGEPIEDSARVMSSMVDIIMIRTTTHDRLIELAENATVPVINGLTDETHPCQLMADVMTYEEHRGSVAGRTFAWTGDGNNVLHSLLEASARFSFDLRIAVPEGSEPGDKYIDWAKSNGGRIEFTRSAEEAVRDADCVMTDTWVSMGQEHRARGHNVFMPYQVNGELMKLAGQDSLFMHCLPAHRGEEVTDEVIDGPHSVVFDEAENRLHAQKAVLAWCLGA